MSRSVLNTNLQIGMFTVPVAFYPLADKQDPELVQATAEGHEVGITPYDKVTGETIDSDEILKGVRGVDGVFHPISKDDLESIEAATKLDYFEIESFIPVAGVPWQRGLKSYYLMAPSKSPVAPLALLHAALVKSKTAGIMKIVLRSRQQEAIVYARGKGLWVTTLAWSEDWTRAAEAESYLEHCQASPSHLKMAVDLIAAHMAEDPQAALDAPSDDLRVARKALIDEALAGKPVKPKSKVATAKTVDNLQAMLEASMQSAPKRKKTAA